MKCTTIITNDREEILIYTKEPTELTRKIEELASEKGRELIGYRGGEGVILSPDEIHLFFIRDGRLFAATDKDEFQLKERLYTIEANLPEGFVKINQSCIANIRKIKSFKASFGGALSVIFKNGYSDYVSRRQMRAVKDALGI